LIYVTMKLTAKSQEQCTGGLTFEIGNPDLRASRSALGRSQCSCRPQLKKRGS
jgi:hypothetical protein